MTELSHHSDYDAMQREMQALRKRIEELEAHRRRPFRRWSWRWLPVTAAVLLALSVLGAQNKQDALFIDSNGNVGINQTSPSETLDVNGTTVIRDKASLLGDLSVGKNLDVSGKLQAKGVIPPANSQKLAAGSGVIIGNSDIYFANTPHAHTAQGNQQGFAAIENDSSQNYNALMILGRSRTNCPPCDRVVDLMDKLGIGKPNPQAPLDVKGEIRGRPWLENRVFEVGGNGGSVKMTKVDHSVCFLTLRPREVCRNWGMGGSCTEKRQLLVSANRSGGRRRRYIRKGPVHWRARRFMVIRPDLSNLPCRAY